MTERRVGELELISRYFAPLARNAASFDLKDDAAHLRDLPPSGIVVTTDAIVAGVHFFDGDSPDDVAYKALAVNVSDLAAKGATPLGYVMTLALPEAPAEEWAAALSSGFEAAQAQFGIELMGGDTVTARGAWWISIAAIGTAPPSGMIRRNGARPGDTIYVSGTLGDAALGLKLRMQDEDLAGHLDSEDRMHLLDRYLRPQPRLALIPALRQCASAAMDLSDGLTLDLKRLCEASGVSGRVDLVRLPLSRPARKAIEANKGAIQAVISGGDDYEILAAIPPNHVARFEAMSAGAEVQVTAIGTIDDDESAPAFRDANGDAISIAATGFQHFQK